MKISLVLGKRGALSRQDAWACLTANLGLPGIGSLMAGRKSGYAQLVLAMAGMALTLLSGTRCIAWFISNWSRLRDPDIDPTMALTDLWFAVRWPLLSIGVFGLAWLWALGSSFFIVQSARHAPPDS